MPLACERDLKPAITFTLKYFLYIFSAVRPSLTIINRRERQNLDHRCNQVAIAPQSTQQTLNTAMDDLRSFHNPLDCAVENFLLDADLRTAERDSIHQMLQELPLPEPTLHEFTKMAQRKEKTYISELGRRYGFTKLSELRLQKIVFGDAEDISHTKTWSPFVPYCVLSVYNSV